MPYDVDGWIEVTGLPPSDGLWLGAISLTALRLSGDAISDQYFGLAKRPRGNALFAGRGVPADPSQHLRADLLANEAFITAHGEGAFGHTYATWRELLAASFAAPSSLVGSEWSDAVRLIQLFGSGNLNYTPDRIRVVVWATW